MVPGPLRLNGGNLDVYWIFCSVKILKGSVLRSVGLQVSLRVVKATLAMGGCQCVAPLMHIF